VENGSYGAIGKIESFEKELKRLYPESRPLLIVGIFQKMEGSFELKFLIPPGLGTLFGGKEIKISKHYMGFKSISPFS